MIRYCLLLFLLFLAGCTVKGDYACGVPATGVGCQPMSTTYQQLQEGSLIAQHTDPFPEEELAEDTAGDYNRDNGPHSSSDRQANSSGTIAVPLTPLASIQSIRSKQAILSQPREMRIWFDRFTDPDGDLHDESFVFIRIDSGHWLIDDKPILY